MDTTGAARDSTVGIATPDTASGELAATEKQSDSTGVTADQSATSTSDTNTAGDSEMARDTSAAVSDTAVASTAPEDSTGRVRPPEDSSEVLGTVTGDTASAMSQDAAVNQSETQPIRPAEDSTELVQAHADTTTGENQPGNDTVAVAPANSAADTTASAASEPVVAEATPAAGQESVPSASSEPSDVAGAAPLDQAVTGSEAVALMSRAGERCVMLSRESTEASWDISDSPINLNPCGSGTMTLSRIRTGETH